MPCSVYTNEDDGDTSDPPTTPAPLGLKPWNGCTSIFLSDRAQLRPLSALDAPELHALIHSNREHLAPWLDWATTQTFEDTLSFTREAEREAAARHGLHAGIALERHIVGVISYMAINWRHRATTLGYWLDAAHQGEGTMTTAVRALVNHAVLVWGLNRVEIRTAVANQLSRAIPERLGFREEATLRQAEFVGGRYFDTVIYTMLAEDWRANSGADESC